MKRIFLTAVFIAGASLALGQTAGKKPVPEKHSTAEQEVLQAENARIQAVVDRDTPALERMLADELTYTHSTGRVESKAGFIQDIRSGELTYVAIKHDDLRVRVYRDAAVLTGRSAMKVKSPRTQNQIQELDVLFLEVYTKRNGRWQQVAWQSTRLAPQ